MPKAPSKNRLQIRLDPHSERVVNRLAEAGIKGTSISEVIAFAVKQWISDHWQEIASYEGTDDPETRKSRERGS